MKLDNLEICERPNLSPEDREMLIRAFPDGEVAYVFTQDENQIRRLLNHPEVEPNPRNMDIEDGVIMTFYGTIPLDCLDDI